MEKIVLKKRKDSLPQIGWYDSQDRDIILFIDTEGVPHALLIRDPLSGESTVRANRIRAKQLTEELENEVEEKCVRITKQGFVGESGAHYILSYPDDVKEDDDGIDVFENVGDPQFSRRKKAPDYEYDHSEWKSYCAAEDKALSCKGVKDSIVISHGGGSTSNGRRLHFASVFSTGRKTTIFTLFDDGTLCSSDSDDLILESDESLSLGDKDAYNNSDIPNAARDKKFVSIHRVADYSSPQCAIAISEDGECVITGEAPRPFKAMIDSGCSVIMAREAESYIECVGIKPNNRLAYAASNPSEKEYAEQMEDAEDIADITFHRSFMIDEDGDEIDVELFAAVSLDNKISLFAADDYVREYTSMIPSEFQA